MGLILYYKLSNFVTLSKTFDIIVYFFAKWVQSQCLVPGLLWRWSELTKAKPWPHYLSKSKSKFLSLVLKPLCFKDYQVIEPLCPSYCYGIVPMFIISYKRRRPSDLPNFMVCYGNHISWRWITLFLGTLLNGFYCEAWGSKIYIAQLFPWQLV